MNTQSITKVETVCYGCLNLQSIKSLQYTPKKFFRCTQILIWLDKEKEQSQFTFKIGNNNQFIEDRVPCTLFHPILSMKHFFTELKFNRIWSDSEEISLIHIPLLKKYIGGEEYVSNYMRGLESIDIMTASPMTDLRLNYTEKVNGIVLIGVSPVNTFN